MGNTPVVVAQIAADSSLAVAARGQMAGSSSPVAPVVVGSKAEDHPSARSAIAAVVASVVASVVAAGQMAQGRQLGWAATAAWVLALLFDSSPAVPAAVVAAVDQMARGHQ